MGFLSCFLFLSSAGLHLRHRNSTGQVGVLILLQLTFLGTRMTHTGVENYEVPHSVVLIFCVVVGVQRDSREHRRLGSRLLFFVF